MERKTLTRLDISEALYRHVGLSKHESALMLETVLEQISNALIDGKSVKLSSFGTFTPRQKRERVGRNPKTGQEVPITARSVVTFRASNVLKTKVNSKNKMKVTELL